MVSIWNILYLKVFLVLALLEVQFQILVGLYVWSVIYALHFSLSRCTNIAYIGMHLVYVVLAYKERLISTVSSLLAILYFRAFNVVNFGKCNSSHLFFFFFLDFFMWLVNWERLICKDVWYCRHI